ncbi:MAG: prepilin peptidase [Sphingomicrobium sp.]
MNLVAAAPLWLMALLAAALAGAAIEDAVRLRISNLSCVAVVLLALVAMGFAGFPLALWQNFVVLAVLLGAGTLLFASGKVGGGDVKLLAAVGMWFDLRAAVWLIAAVFLSGGLIAIGYILARLLFRPSEGEGRKKIGSRKIPYGLAIVAGAAFAFLAQSDLNKPTPKKANPFSVIVPR